MYSPEPLSPHVLANFHHCDKMSLTVCKEKRYVWPMASEVSTMGNYPCCFGSMTTEDIVIPKDFTSYPWKAERKNNQGPITSPMTPMTQFVSNRLLPLKAPPPPRDTTLGISLLIFGLWGDSQDTNHRTLRREGQILQVTSV